VFLAIFLKQNSVLSQKQSTSSISPSKGVLVSIKVLKQQISKMANAGNIEGPESSSPTPINPTNV